MMSRQLQDPRSRAGTKVRFAAGSTTMPGRESWEVMRNPGSILFPAVTQPVPPAERRQQQEMALLANQRKTSGKIEVVPFETAIPMSGPPSWPPIPPAYVPRAGMWVVTPYQTESFASDRPQPQVYNKVPVILRPPPQRLWINNNPGVIDVRGLEPSPETNWTTDKSQTAYTPIWLK